MRDDVIHAVDVALAADQVAIEHVHCGPEARQPLRHRIVLSRLPLSDEHVVRRRLLLLHWRHPPVDGRLEGHGGVLLQIFRVVEEVGLDSDPNGSVVVVPASSKQSKS